MPDITSAFRSAIVGGFRREDVVDYIEKLSSTHRSEIAQLQRELAERKTELESARTFSSGVEDKLAEKIDESAGLSGELDVLKAERNALKAELETGMSENSRLTASLADAEKRATEFGERSGELQNMLDEIERAKVRVADIELAAYDRARNIEDKARESAGRAMEALTRLYGDARHRFDRARAEAETSITDISGELERVHSTLNALVYRFEEISVDMSELRLDDAVVELLKPAENTDGDA